MTLSNADLISIIGAFIIAATLGCAIVPNILFIAHKKRLFDLPNNRKVHTMPVPRLGGVSFFPVILMTFCLTIGLRHCFGLEFGSASIQETAFEYLFLTVGCVLLYLVGVADDLVGVGYRYKFVVQVAAACLLVFSGNCLNSLGGLFGFYAVPVWFGIPFTILAVVYITNAINLIDGIDGLASGLCCIALAALGLMLALQGDISYCVLALATFGVLMPFWFYNVFGNALRGHKLFMGDTGSLTLGYILSFLVIHLSKSDGINACTNEKDIVLAFSTLLVPLLDVARVVMYRLRNGKSPFLPDKNHIHHKLQRTGMRIGMILTTIFSMALFFLVLNFLLVGRISTTGLLLLDIVVWIVMQAGINWRMRVNSNRVPQDGRGIE